jgi:uncharacterized RDD family membrane protein YckC
MNLETPSPRKSPAPPVSDEFEDFDFRPLTSGLGFQQQKPTTEIRPAFIERPVVQAQIRPVTPVVKTEATIYQNDLSLFYGREQAVTAPEVREEKPKQTLRRASKSTRVVAYALDLALLASVESLILTIMSRLIDQDLLETWSNYPNEITPLVVTLFCGFYLLYFSIFEKTNTSTLGKSLFKLHVVTEEEKSQTLSLLLLRSLISLLNFVSLGLFSYFDLQSRVSDTKVVRIN